MKQKVEEEDFSSWQDVWNTLLNMDEEENNLDKRKKEYREYIRRWNHLVGVHKKLGGPDVWRKK